MRVDGSADKAGDFQFAVERNSEIVEIVNLDSILLQCLTLVKRQKFLVGIIIKRRNFLRIFRAGTVDV